jgi:hypothetical protein
MAAVPIVALVCTVDEVPLLRDDVANRGVSLV